MDGAAQLSWCSKVGMHQMAYVIKTGEGSSVTVGYCAGKVTCLGGILAILPPQSVLFILFNKQQNHIQRRLNTLYWKHKAQCIQNTKMYKYHLKMYISYHIYIQIWFSITDSDILMVNFTRTRIKRKVTILFGVYFPFLGTLGGCLLSRPTIINSKTGTQRQNIKCLMHLNEQKHYWIDGRAICSSDQKMSLSQHLVYK